MNQQLRSGNAYGVGILCVFVQSGSQWTLGLPALLTGIALACSQAEMRNYDNTSWMLPDGTTIKPTLDLHRAEPSHIEGVTEGDRGEITTMWVLLSFYFIRLFFNIKLLRQVPIPTRHVQALYFTSVLGATIVHENGGPTGGRVCVSALSVLDAQR